MALGPIERQSMWRQWARQQRDLVVPRTGLAEAMLACVRTEAEEAPPALGLEKRAESMGDGLALVDSIIERLRNDIWVILVGDHSRLQPLVAMTNDALMQVVRFALMQEGIVAIMSVVRRGSICIDISEASEAPGYDVLMTGTNDMEEIVRGMTELFPAAQLFRQKR